MKVLLAGGAGYIGSHTCVELIEAGHSVIIADNYSNSCPVAIERVEEITGTKIPHYEADVCDPEAVDRIFSENEIDKMWEYVKNLVDWDIEIYANFPDANMAETTDHGIESHKNSELRIIKAY